MKVGQYVYCEGRAEVIEGLIVGGWSVATGQPTRRMDDEIEPDAYFLVHDQETNALIRVAGWNVSIDVMIRVP